MYFDIMHMVRKVMLEKPWPPVALGTGGPAPQEWEGFSFSNITLRNFTLPKKQKLTFWVSSF